MLSLITAATSVLLATSPVQAQVLPPNCAAAPAIIQGLLTNYGEEIVEVIPDLTIELPDGRVVTNTLALFADPISGTWTITSAHGVAADVLCVQLAGEDYVEGLTLIDLLVSKGIQVP